MINARVKFTYEDYIHLPEGKRHEVIEGDLMMVPSPEFRHQYALGELYSALRNFVKKNDLGIVIMAPLDVLLSEENIVQPDLLFISKERSGIISTRFIQGPPDLVVEISSPSTRDRDRTAKKRLYAKYGVQEYWIVDLDSRTVEVLTAGESGYQTMGVFPQGTVLQSKVLSGLNLSISDIL